MSDDKKGLKKPTIKSAKSAVNASKTKWIVGGIGLVVVVLLIARITGGDHAIYKAPPPASINTTPGSDNLYQSDLANHVETLSTQNNQLHQQLDTLTTQLAALEKKQQKQDSVIANYEAKQKQLANSPRKPAPPPPSPQNGNNPNAPMNGASFKAPPTPQQTNGYVPPPPPASGYGKGSTAGPSGQNEALAIPSDTPVIVVNADAGKSGKKGLSVQWQKNAFAGYLPAGSFAKAVLLTGIDAGTSNYTRSNPEPVLMRVENNAYLPGAARYGIKTCFLIGSGYGDLSSERVFIRLSRISCVSQALHSIVSSPISGYVVDSDGVLGMRGRIINRTGALLAKAMLAGFAQGAAQIAQYASSAVTTSSLTGSVTSTISPNKVLQGGAFSGVGNAAAILAKAYIKEANNIYPVIEVPPGRKSSVVISQGVSLHWESYTGLYKPVPKAPSAGTINPKDSAQLSNAQSQTAQAFQQGQSNQTQQPTAPAVANNQGTN